jgi:hypothetical protein
LNKSIDERIGKNSLDSGKEILEEHTKENDAPSLRTFDTKNKTVTITLLAVFTALGPALSISFIWLPYFELMTLTLFIGGFILGYTYGIALAILSSTLYEIIATIIVGPAFIVFPFKIIAYLVITCSGAFIGKILPKKGTISWRIFLAVLGGLLTLCFDLCVNLGLILFLDYQLISYFTILVLGLPATTIRIATNSAFFFLIYDILNRGINPLMEKYQGEEKKVNRQMEETQRRSGQTNKKVK